MQIAAPPCCEAQARWFYGTLIGLPELEKPQALRVRGGVWLGLGDAQLHIGIEEPFATDRKAYAAMRFSSDELRAVAKQLIDVGAPVRWDEELPDFRRFSTDDPWGNRLELLARRH